MAKLFALENAELEGGAEVELEAAPEVGEVADVQVEVEADGGEIAEVEAGVDEGMGAADQLEQVEEVVADAAEGEGLDPVAAEAIKIAVEAICARVGANPKAVYSLYATENFKSASSRKANTKYALEGLGEFLKNLWEKIKAAVSALWEKVKAFWNKHVSSLGRSLKALESMKAKVSALKGSPVYEPVEVPGALKSLYPTKGDLSVDDVRAFGAAVAEAEKGMDAFRLMEATEATDLAKIESQVATAVGSGVVVAFGSEAKPLPGGKYFKWTFKLEEDKADDVVTRTLQVEEDHGSAEAGNKTAKLEIAGKDKLKALIEDTIKGTKSIIKRRDDVEKRAKACSNTFKAIDKSINAEGADAKAGRLAMRSFNLIMTKGPSMEAKLLGLQLSQIKGVLGFTAACVKGHKQV